MLRTQPRFSRLKSLIESLYTRKKWLLGTAAAVLVAGIAIITFFYVKFAILIEEKLGQGNRPGYSALYAAPRIVAVGDKISSSELIAHLERAGYSSDARNKVGHYRIVRNGLEITTGSDSYFQPHVVEIQFEDGGIERIYSVTTRTASPHYALEPELISSVFGNEREKRRPVRFTDLPAHLVQAVISIEDKRFFQHGGFDVLRIVKAAYVDVREGRKEQGASTITMQLARSFWLDQEKEWGRKLSEALLAAELERRFNKQQLFELYANEVYLGSRSSFALHGFAQAARAYFGKGVRNLTVDESATLAGIIQRPSYFNPFRFPERVKARRDLVLNLMHQNGFIDARQLADAAAKPITLNPAATEPSDAPYFVDLANTGLRENFGKLKFTDNTYRVYTTLDVELQKEAEAAVQIGMAEVDKLIRRKQGKKKGPLPQVALVAIDPRTGAVKALVGGRDYSKTQLNRALALRQPGSSFKPFVYAAALQTAVDRNSNRLTAATRVDDLPTTWHFNHEDYTPANFADQYFGSVTLRQALTKSMNIAAIKVAEKAGYENVVQIAKRAGINSNLLPTPSLALGSYEVTPLEIASAYTMFPNDGMYLPRFWVSTIRDRRNRMVYRHTPKENPVVDPRVAYIMVNMMEDVIRSGTAAGVRSRGFSYPAAGKTGTSRDGWFAGFTSKLICAVWVGFDDNKELDLEGSKSALPVWTEFMKRAHKLNSYKGPEPFKAPAGITRAAIDINTGLLASESCENVRTELFLAGTQPRTYCGGHEEEMDYVEEVTAGTAGERKSIWNRVFGVFR